MTTTTTAAAAPDWDWNVIIFEYVCPSLGVLISSALYAAPVNDLRKCLQQGSLGSLNPVPWAILSGNCFGWTAYAYYAQDPFILAANIPGLITTVWLNLGASKLQYYEEMESSNEITGIERESSGSNSSSTATGALPPSRKELLIFTPQDVLWIRVLSMWMVILVAVGWLGLVNGREKETVGLLVNINLLFFYGAPLQTIGIVVQDKCSDSIHTPTMLLNCTNATFWGAYGVATNNIVIYGPNGIGLLLALTQALLCCIYQKSSPPPADVDARPLLDNPAEGHDIADDEPASFSESPAV
mmetsp:Transcript_11226/g.18056  ORF Transcript_11226/g.18056 Transcript_11226/m.18056 type:complete len:299 (+) Transcript_11226:111-1007(+)